MSFLIIILIISLVVALASLRQNYQTMVDLRQQVFDADRVGADDIDAKLIALRNFVVNHMNTDLQKNKSLNNVYTEKPIQLAYRYYRDNLEIHRLQLTKQFSVTKDRTNLDAFELAKSKCEAVDNNGEDKYDISVRLNCFLGTSVVNSDGFYPEIEPLPKDYYVFNFPSPGWSPDRAGWSIVVGIVSLFSLVVVTVLWVSRLILYKFI